MKQAIPVVPAPQHFGLNVIKVSENTSRSSSPLLKPVENHSNLTVCALEPYQHTQFSVINRQLNLGRFTELKSLRFENISFADCEYDPIAKMTELAFKPLTQLRSLTLCRAFLDHHADSNVKRSAQRFFMSGFAQENQLQLEEFQFHYNDVKSWDLYTWLFFGGVLKQLKRFSFKCSDKLSWENAHKLQEKLEYAEHLVSCEFEIPEFDQWDLLLSKLRVAQLRVLELGTFDFWSNSKKSLVIIENVLKKFPGLQTLGLKVKRWDSRIAGELFDLLSKHGRNLSQLIIDTSVVEHDTASLKNDLDKTKLLDVRFVQGSNDCTPAEVTNLCIDKISEINVSIQAKKGKLEDSKFIALNEEFISKLSMEYASVPMLRHQINMIMHKYLDLLELDKTKKIQLSQFIAKFSQWIEAGKMSTQYIVRLLGNVWNPSQYDDLLGLLSAGISGCNGPEDAKNFLGPRFVGIVINKLRNLQSLTSAPILSSISDSNELEKYWLEACDLEAMICDKKYLVLLDNVQRYGYLLTLNLIKELLSDRLGRKKEYVEDFVKLHSKEFAKTTDSGVFYNWFLDTINVIFTIKASNESYAKKLLSVVFCELKTSTQLLQARAVLRDFNCPPSENMFMLKLSLIILRRAIQEGFDDTEKQYQTYLNDYMRTSGKNFIEVMDEIDQLADEICKVEVPEMKPAVVEAVTSGNKAVSEKVSLKDLLKSDRTEGLVPLRDLLRSKKEDAVQEETVVRPSLKDLLKSKKEPASPTLGKFFDEQSRNGADEGQDAEVDNTHN